MNKQLDQQWWSGYRTELEKRFRQEALSAPAQEIRIFRNDPILRAPILRARKTAARLPATIGANY